jgi:hypothetical protein
MILIINHLMERLFRPVRGGRFNLDIEQIDKQRF